MKALIITIVAFSLLQSCGRDNNECRSREHMVVRCQAENTPIYGYRTSQEICDRSYESERCW